MLESVEELWQSYKLETIWLLIAVMVIQSAWRFLKKQQGKGYIRASDDERVNAELKYQPYWIMLAPSLLMALLFLYVTISEVGITNDRENFISLGLALISVLAAYSQGKKTLDVKITQKGLHINYSTYAAEELARIEIWDDLLYIKAKGDKEEKFWLKYDVAQFHDLAAALKLIEKFCDERQVPFENNFDFNVETNTTFKKEPKAPRTWKERWEEFSKIPPREKLPQ